MAETGIIEGAKTITAFTKTGRYTKIFSEIFISGSIFKYPNSDIAVPVIGQPS